MLLRYSIPPADIFHHFAPYSLSHPSRNLDDCMQRLQIVPAMANTFTQHIDYASIVLHQTLVMYIVSSTKATDRTFHLLLCHKCPISNGSQRTTITVTVSAPHRSRHMTLKGNRLLLKAFVCSGCAPCKR